MNNQTETKKKKNAQRSRQSHNTYAFVDPELERGRGDVGFYPSECQVPGSENRTKQLWRMASSLPCDYHLNVLSQIIYARALLHVHVYLHDFDRFEYCIDNLKIHKQLECLSVIVTEQHNIL